MRILSLDVATNTGWAVFDHNDTPSSIACGSLHFDGDGPLQKIKDIRNKLPAIFKQYQPEFVVMEAPLQVITRFEKKQPKDLFAGADAPHSANGKAPKKEMTMNPKTVFVLNRLHGAVQMIAEGFRVPVVEVAPLSWQAIIPDKYKGSTKERVRQFCDALQIIGKNEDARDAAIIAWWCANRSQEFKDHFYSSKERKSA